MCIVLSNKLYGLRNKELNCSSEVTDVSDMLDSKISSVMANNSA